MVNINVESTDELNLSKIKCLDTKFYRSRSVARSQGRIRGWIHGRIRGRIRGWSRVGVEVGVGLK